MSESKIAVKVEGGVGKHIAFTATLPKLKEKYDEIILISAYPEVFIGNDNVWRNLGFNHPYLYEDYLKEVRVISSEAYLTDDYRFKKSHLIEAYSAILDVKYTKNMLPEVFIQDNEEEAFKEQFLKGTIQDKEYIVVQIAGGTSYYTPQMVGQKLIKSRDYPKELAKQFCLDFMKKYPNIVIVQVGLPTEYKLNSEPELAQVLYMTNLTSRAFFPVIEHCKTFVVIDSFLSHISAAFKKKGIVLWGGTNPKNLGYEHNVNVSDSNLCTNLFCNRPNTFLFDHVTGALWQCNKKYSCMRIPPATIMAEITKLIGAPKKDTPDPIEDAIKGKKDGRTNSDK